MITTPRSYRTKIETPLGMMIAWAYDSGLYRLEFASHDTKYTDSHEKNSLLISLESEITNYFQGTLSHFTIPLCPEGTSFQHRIWMELIKIPLGKTQSYAEIASRIGKPNAYRAVARANSTNKLALIIPCHRVINTNGNLGGYNGGIDRKQWLLEHEKNMLCVTQS